MSENAPIKKRHTPRIDPVSETVPQDWKSEEEMLAKEALRMLHKHYKNWAWGVEFSACDGKEMSSMIIRLLDVPTDIVYVINYKDIDKDRMLCVMRAGGLLLEALGIKPDRAKGDAIRGMMTNAAGLLVPNHAAMPETNTGYAKVKKEFEALTPNRIIT